MTHRREELFVDTITTATTALAARQRMSYISSTLRFCRRRRLLRRSEFFFKLVCQLRMSCPGPNLAVVGKKRLSALIEKQGTEQEVHQ